MYGWIRTFSLIAICMASGLATAQTSSSLPVSPAATQETRILVDKLSRMLDQGSTQNFLSSGKLADFESQIDFGAMGSFETGAFGPGEGGGGDPMAQQFIQMARRLALFFNSNPDRVVLPFDPSKFRKVVDQIEKSVKDESVRDLIFFTNKALVDQQGVPKVAFFDRSTFTIVVSRDFWRRASAEEKLALVTMEILGLLSVKDSRYERATSLLRDRTAAILSLPLPHDGGFAMPGMRIVGKDPDQFGRLTENDVVIDVGVIGVDLRATRRLAKFLDDPTSNRPWMEAIARARRLRRPAYFVIPSPDANRVAVVALYDTRYSDGLPGMAAYGLKLVKRRQIYSGPCAGDARAFRTIERMRNCFLNMENYSAGDFLINKKLGAEGEADGEESLLGQLTRDLKKSLLSFFSQDTRTLQEVTSAHFIRDYSTIVADPKRADIVVNTYRRIVLDASARANGLAPHFEGPYSQIWFWAPTARRDFSSDRFFAALMTLASNRLGFIDHMTKCGSEAGPRLVDLDRLREYRFARACREEPTTHFPNLEEEIYIEMVKLGFRYDAHSRNWKREAVPGHVLKPVSWLGSMADEIRIRFMTENLSADGKLRVLREALAASGLEDRFEIYQTYLPKAWSYGFSQPQIDGLYREAWRSVIESPKWLQSNSSFLRFTAKSYAVAVSDIRLGREVADLYRYQMPEFSWFSQPHVFEAWYSIIEGSNQVKIKPFVLDLVRRPTFDQKSADFLATQLAKSHSKLGATTASGNSEEKLSNDDRSELLEAIIASGKLSKAQREVIASSIAFE